MDRDALKQIIKAEMIRSIQRQGADPYSLPISINDVATDVAEAMLEKLEEKKT